MHGISGALDRLHLGDLLEWLHLTKATGRLLLTGGPVTRAFDISHGKVIFASSSRASERLASWLLRRGEVGRQSLLRSLAISQTRGELFTTVVEREAGVSKETIIAAGRAPATALASRVLREERIIFTFDPSWPVAQRHHVDLDLECSKLIMQAAYRADTVAPTDASNNPPPATLDEETLESVFWSITSDLDGDLVEASAFGEAHASFLKVGELLHRWVTQGPPLLPVGPADTERALARLDAGEEVAIEDSPTLAWDLLSLINGLDAPGVSRAASAHDAWVLAGDDAGMLVRLIVENSRWRREWRGDSDDALRRTALARIAAARCLAKALNLPEPIAATAGALPVVLLELVATALASTPMASASMQRCALRHLLPLVGHAAGTAAGLPESLIAALSLDPANHPTVRLSGLIALAAGELQGFDVPAEATVMAADDAISSAIRAGRQAASEIAGED
jgi:hypothetical protein